MAAVHVRRRPFGKLPCRVGKSRSSAVLAFEQLESRSLFAADLPLVVDRPTVNLSAQEQLLVEQINFARAHPADSAARLGIDLNAGLGPSQFITADAKSPLAVRQSLVDAAGVHSQEMLDRDLFAHELPGATGSSTPGSRALAQGYAHPVGENIAVRSIADDPINEVLAAHDQLFRSPGHRVNLLREDYRDLGVGIRRGDFLFDSGATLNSLMTTEEFGLVDSLAITGVVFDDAIDDDDRYSAGEGIAGVLIQAIASGGTVYRTHSGTSGGYSLDVPNGDYALIVSGSGLPQAVTIPNVHVAGRNVKVDITPAMSAATISPVDPNNGSSGSQLLPSNLWAYDVSRDGQITPGDALLVLNYLNEGPGAFDALRDVSGDGVVAPIDALMVINFMNTYGSGFVVPSELTLAFEPTDERQAAELPAERHQQQSDPSAARRIDDIVRPVVGEWEFDPMPRWLENRQGECETTKDTKTTKMEFSDFPNLRALRVLRGEMIDR